MTDETRGADIDAEGTGEDDIPRDEEGEPLPPLTADKALAPAAISSSYGEEVPTDA
ncbi:hypothetical protein [Leifsonia xyli]|uniref:hypothetical protein n=1 Tax=Leifsonia xyli TaxID=1575 RepID=UPI003D66934F